MKPASGHAIQEGGENLPLLVFGVSVGAGTVKPKGHNKYITSEVFPRLLFVAVHV